MKNILYPLLLTPVIKDYIWGGTRLIDEFGFSSDTESAAEAWVLASHKNGTNIVKNGVFSGKTLDEVLKIWGTLPSQNRYINENFFPLLIKLIDAKQKLSVQVHPDDDYALKNEGELGKTEMWYVVDCAKGAELVFGFNKNTSKQEFEERIKNNTLDEILNYVPVKKGDVFFIESGTLHAIGEGILIAEIQQNSNTTYRVSDYGRLDKNGNPRELHIEKALEVTNTSIVELNDTDCEKKYDYGTEKLLAECEYFSVKHLNLKGKKEILSDNSFVSLLLIDGFLEITSDNEKIVAKKGDSILIPASFSAEINGEAELIISTLP